MSVSIELTGVIVDETGETIKKIFVIIWEEDGTRLELAEDPETELEDIIERLERGEIQKPSQSQGRPNRIRT